MRTPNTLMYLTNVQYLPEKRQIVAEMANKREKLSFRYAFYPKLFLSANPAAEELILELLRAYQNQKFTIQRINSETIKIECATFSDLKHMAIVLQKNLQIPCLVIEPERQFLIEMDWSYFDSFKVNCKNEIISKTDFNIAPKAKLDFLAIPLDETLNHLINADVGKAKDLTGRICLSNILRIKPNEVPETKAMLSEIKIGRASCRERV